MKRLIERLLLPGLFCSLATTVFGAPALQFSLDEFGHGLVQTNGVDSGTFSSSYGPDPTGGVPVGNVLIYTLPFLGRQGDLLINDPSIAGSPLVDVLRFDGNSHLIVYSDNVLGYDSPGDTAGPPDPFYANVFLSSKQHAGPIGFADFSPQGAGFGDGGLGEPGYDISNPSYHFLDPGLVPEPSAAVLILGGLGILGLGRFRRSLAGRGSGAMSRPQNPERSVHQGSPSGD